MHEFHYEQKKLYCEEVPVEGLVERHGTPLYIYSQKTLEDHYQKLARALAPLNPLICYAVKANSNNAIIRVLANQRAGFDIVSEGELARVVAAGGEAAKCVFAGVGKTEREIEFALRQGIYSFNVESEPELARIDKVAGRLGMIAPVAVRVNPNIDPGTHAKITTGTYENKFGIAYEHVESVYARARKFKNLRLRGLQMHIGSQLTSVKPFELAVKRVLPLLKTLTPKYGLEFFSLGGGVGIVYEPALESGEARWWKTDAAQGILTPATYAERLVPLLEPLKMQILIEPGRFIVGNAGILVTQVQYVKQTRNKNFVIVDAAMNDLIRPAFYDSYHEIIPVTRPARQGREFKADVVGPICESSDYFAKHRVLPAVAQGDCLALLSAGAYGSVMSSNYNSRPLPAEVLVKGKESWLVRPRQELEEIWDKEQIPDWLKKG